MSTGNPNVRLPPDRIMVELADYALDYKIRSSLAYDTASIV